MTKKIEKVAPTDVSVLVFGESGTGKELIARAIHEYSTRSNFPMVKVNCAEISAGLVESELFGHEKRAFTGAHERRKGRFELANRGTLFLDEVGELTLDIQVKLLRVLQEQELERVGSEKTIKVDVRIVAATHKNLMLKLQACGFAKISIIDCMSFLSRYRLYEIVVMTLVCSLTIFSRELQNDWANQHRNLIKRVLLRLGDINGLVIFENYKM